MKLYLRQKNKNALNTQSGFTLLETLVAILILTIALDSLFIVISSSLFNAQYAKNEITATYLAQEVVDFIRNDRDTTAIQQGKWTEFLARYDIPAGQVGSSSVCRVDVGPLIPPSNIGDPRVLCDTSAGTSAPKSLYYDSSAAYGEYYTHDSALSGVAGTPFTREVALSLSPTNKDELDIVVTVTWNNGSINRTRALQTSLLKWQ